MLINNTSEKFNFVDINNVFVGYDSGQCCCEDAGWFIAEEITPKIYDERFNKIKYENKDVEEYVFDTTFFKDVASEDIDSGGMVAFRLIAENKPDLYLHLYNSHNGYYGHGFDAEIDGQKWQDGCL